MLNASETTNSKILCPVCYLNLELGKFESHMDFKHKDFKDRIKMDKNVVNTLYRASLLKHSTNNVYYNWSYHIKIKYQITDEDRKTYKDAIYDLKEVKHVKANEENIITWMQQYDPDQYGIKILTRCIVKMLSI